MIWMYAGTPISMHATVDTGSVATSGIRLTSVYLWHQTLLIIEVAKHLQSCVFMQSVSPY